MNEQGMDRPERLAALYDCIGDESDALMAATDAGEALGALTAMTCTLRDAVLELLEKALEGDA